MEEVLKSLEDLEAVDDLEILEDQEASLEDDLDDKLIQSVRERVDVADETLPGLPSLLRELGVRLCMRFSTTYDLCDLEEAIHAIEKAIRLTTLEDVTNRSTLFFDL